MTSISRDDVNEPREEPSKIMDSTRDAMRSYWSMHTDDGVPTNSTMMLMNDATAIDEAEQQEILELLPEVRDMDILELGCGIGRFTGHLAQDSSSVIAVDFMQKCIDKNIEDHGHLENITFMCEDVTNLSLKPGQFDMVFSNWLQMYLNDEEVEELARKMVSWVKPGGVIFFRESCKGGPSGDKPRLVNPTFYRPHYFYTRLFSGLGLMLVRCCLVECYVTMKNKTNQYVWVFEKRE